MPTEEVDPETLAIAELYDLQYEPKPDRAEKFRDATRPAKNTHKHNKQTQLRSQQRAQKYASYCYCEK